MTTWRFIVLKNLVRVHDEEGKGTSLSFCGYNLLNFRFGKPGKAHAENQVKLIGLNLCNCLIELCSILMLSICPKIVDGLRQFGTFVGVSLVMNLS